MLIQIRSANSMFKRSLYVGSVQHKNGAAIPKLFDCFAFRPGEDPAVNQLVALVRFTRYNRPLVCAFKWWVVSSPVFEKIGYF
jgi:hypothetical protein